MRLCQTVVVVADAAKWGRVGVTSYAMLSDVDTVITDAQAPPDLVAQVRTAGVKVMLV